MRRLAAAVAVLVAAWFVVVIGEFLTLVALGGGPFIHLN